MHPMAIDDQGYDEAADERETAIPQASPTAKSLSQVQIIRSLADALAWFEKELSWSVAPQELKHLTGRIGELYAAMITRGQMALEVHQQGYDVVSAEGEHISVKTITTSTHVTFNKSTIQHVDRVMVLRINVDEGEASIEEIFDGPRDEMVAKCSDAGSKLHFMISTPRASKPVEDLKVVDRGIRGDTAILQLENGTILVEIGGVRQPVAKPILRRIAEQIGVSLLNGAGNKKNTRQLGASIISALKD